MYIVYCIIHNLKEFLFFDLLDTQDKVLEEHSLMVTTTTTSNTTNSSKLGNKIILLKEESLNNDHKNYTMIDEPLYESKVIGSSIFSPPVVIAKRYQISNSNTKK